MTDVLINRGTWDTDMNTGKMPCEAEGIDHDSIGEASECPKQGKIRR